MSLYRRAARRDNTHAPIRDVLRQAGCLVIDLGGVVDLLAYDPPSRTLTVIDCKTPENQAGKVSYTDNQKRLLADGWPLVILRSTDEAIDAVISWRKR